MVMRAYPNGLGGTLGDSLVTQKGLHKLGGEVWYLDSVTGNDSNDGRERGLPLATLAQAQTNASNGDIIDILSTHTETLTGALTISKRILLVGEGDASGKPTAQFKNNQAAGKLFVITATNVEIRNLLFPENVQACSAVRIDVQADGFRMRGSRMECGENDNAAALLLTSGDQPEIDTSTFISTATSTAPGSGIQLGGTITNAKMDGTVFDGGTIGFNLGRGFDANANNLTRFRFESLSLLNGADMHLTAASTGYVSVPTASGGAIIDPSG